MATPRKPARSSGRPAPAKASKPGKKAAKKSAAAGRAREPISLLLRGLDPEVVGVLRARAERSGRSLQQELHAALRRDAKRNFDEAAAISAAWHDRLRGRELPDSTELLRDDRVR
jgi:plasmid stability protein